MSSEITAKNAAKQPFVAVLRELVRAYQAFSACDAEHLREFGLTTPQADVIFTLGNTQGMTFKEIGEQTLITKGTLTGVVDRLEEKGLLKRVASEDDRRRTIVVLTAKGEKVFEDVFPKHIKHLKARFDCLSKTELKEAEAVLKKIKYLF